MNLNYRLGFEEYNMKTYWSARASYAKISPFLAVCAFTDNYLYNLVMHLILRKQVLKVFNKILKFYKDKTIKVLEIGCGLGRWYMILRNNFKNLEYYGIDISEEMIKVAKRLTKYERFYVMSASKLEFPDNYFDVVFSITVLHHIPFKEKEKAIKEMIRVTKKGGYIIIIEDFSLKKLEDFNLFTYPIETWIKKFEDNNCKLVHLEYHKCKLILNKLCNNKKIAKIIRNLNLINALVPLEEICKYTLSRRFFQAFCAIFKKL